MSKPTKNMVSGDRVGYAAKFLHNACAFTGDMPQRRGTFISYWDANPDFARIKWDDFEAMVATGKGQYGDTEYVDDARQYGQCVHACNIAKVGSPRFVLNDL